MYIITRVTPSKDFFLYQSNKYPGIERARKCFVSECYYVEIANRAGVQLEVGSTGDLLETGDVPG